MHRQHGGAAGEKKAMCADGKTSCLYGRDGHHKPKRIPKCGGGVCSPCIDVLCAFDMDFSVCSRISYFAYYLGIAAPLSRMIRTLQDKAAFLRLL